MTSSAAGCPQGAPEPCAASRRRGGWVGSRHGLRSCLVGRARSPPWTADRVRADGRAADKPRQRSARPGRRPGLAAQRNSTAADVRIAPVLFDGGLAGSPFFTESAASGIMVATEPYRLRGVRRIFGSVHYGRQDGQGQRGATCGSSRSTGRPGGALASCAAPRGR